MTDSVEGSNVIPIPAKRVEGSKRNTTWTWVFNRETRKWDWKVTVTMLPQEFTGSATTEAAAKLEVEEIVRQLGR